MLFYDLSINMKSNIGEEFCALGSPCALVRKFVLENSLELFLIWFLLPVSLPLSLKHARLEFTDFSS